MKPNQATIDLIKQFEGCRLEAYLDAVGVPTIGYGLTDGALPGVPVRMGMTISQAQAELYLSMTLEKFANQILPMMGRQPTPDQFGAMLSLAYNIGTGAFRKSTCLKRFNAGDIDGAAEAITWFNKAGGKVLRGLVRRREAERDLFLGGGPVEARTRPDAPKTATQSTTNLAAVAGGVTMLAGVSDQAKGLIGDVSESFGIDPKYILLTVGLCAVAWIIKERVLKARNMGI